MEDQLQVFVQLFGWFKIVFQNREMKSNERRRKEQNL